MEFVLLDEDGHLFRTERSVTVWPDWGKLRFGFRVDKNKVKFWLFWRDTCKCVDC